MEKLSLLRCYFPNRALPIKAMSIISELIETRQLRIVYQPIIDLKQAKVFSYEALLRCSHPDYKSPLDVIDAAVKEKTMGQLGRTLRAMSIAGCPDHTLFLNVHPDEFSDRWLVQPNDPLVTHQADVYLEITESMPLSHYQFCHSVLSEIRAKDIKLAVDDLGAGYSNLKYIVDLEPDVVKLDIELIAGMTTGSRQFRLVRSMVQLCEDQDARVVAEGIETREELQAVIAAGVHFGQGYYLARPNEIPPTRDWSTILNG